MSGRRSGALRQAEPSLLEGPCWPVVARWIAIVCIGGYGDRRGRTCQDDKPEAGPRILRAEVEMEHRAMPPAEPGMPQSGAADFGIFSTDRPRPQDIDPASLDDPRTLQILATEHWSLLASRSMTWNESFTRTGLFLSVLSASVVALGLVGGATDFASEFALFALVLLPVTLFVGVATFVRLDEANMEDLLWVVGMNRIRNAYLRIVPGVEPFMITGATDDEMGVGRTFLMTQRPTAANTIVHQFVTTPGMVAVIDGVLAACIAGILIASVGPGMSLGIGVGVVVGIATTFVLFATSIRRGRRIIGTYRPRFPSATDEPPGSPFF